MTNVPNLVDDMKRRAAAAAVAMVTRGMRLGIGTGSTAAHAIALLGIRNKSEKLRVVGVPTSRASETLMQQHGIRVVTLADVDGLDLAFDGADEVDPQLNLIKGGGGALLREKVVAHAAERFVVMVDAHKRVPVLGAFALPVEVVPFAAAAVSRTLTALGARVQLRGGTEPFVSDNGNHILDAAFARIDDPPLLARALDAVPGICAHGLFCGMTQTLIVGTDNGTELVVATA